MKRIQTTKIYSIVDEALAGGYKIVSAQGSSRSSKTYNILIFLIIYLLTHPNTSLTIVRATLTASRGSVMRDFFEILGNMGIFNQKSLNKAEFIYHFDNGSFAEFISTDNEQKLRGRKRNILFVNEANELKFIEWQQLIMRTTRFAIVDYNPSFSDDHWLCALNSRKDVYHFISTYQDNPFLEETVIAEIEALREKNASLWQIYGLGQQAVIEGLIFTNVQQCEKIPIDIKRRFIGIDFGFTHDPTAIIEVGITPDELYVREICYRTEMLTSDIIEVLRPYRHYKIISECADPRLIREIQRAGFNIHPVVKSGNSVMAGIDKMLQYAINITQGSDNVLKEYKNYVYQQDKEGNWLNVPIDRYNHSIDALRYVVLMEILGKGYTVKNLEGIF